MERIKYFMLMFLTYPIFGAENSSFSVIDFSNFLCRVHRARNGNTLIKHLGVPGVIGVLVVIAIIFFLIIPSKKRGNSVSNSSNSSDENQIKYSENYEPNSFFITKVQAGVFVSGENRESVLSTIDLYYKNGNIRRFLRNIISLIDDIDYGKVIKYSSIKSLTTAEEQFKHLSKEEEFKRAEATSSKDGYIVLSLLILSEGENISTVDENSKTIFSQLVKQIISWEQPTIIKSELLKTPNRGYFENNSDLESCYVSLDKFDE
ncbi:hypothetical protein JXR93_10730 [bacterium]|nr:hypothetical protein [bacterium]